MHNSFRQPLFENRRDAGVKLAAKLEDYQNLSVTVLAIPNGGVPVATEVASYLDAEMDIVVSRKIPIPLMPGGGFGAVADDGTTIFNEEVLRAIDLDEHQINYQVNQVRNDIRTRSLFYRNNRPLAVIKSKTVIIVDDGLASGYTMIAAVESIRRRQPARIVVAIPAASDKAVAEVQKVADKVITVETASVAKFYIADYYRYWYDVSEEEGLRYYKDYQQRYREAHFTPPLRITPNTDSFSQYRKRNY
ncbi:MAG: phosphoribosyl transferase [Dehalococcoidia bacterium]|nr:phosphoribosyl transferase [Dehalococcoidia bacterium]